MEAIVSKSTPNGLDSKAVVILVRNGAIVRGLEVVMPTESDEDAYATQNASAIYNDPGAFTATMRGFQAAYESKFIDYNYNILFSLFSGLTTGDIDTARAAALQAVAADETKQALFNSIAAKLGVQTGGELTLEQKRAQAFFMAHFAVIGLLSGVQ